MVSNLQLDFVTHGGKHQGQMQLLHPLGRVCVVYGRGVTLASRERDLDAREQNSPRYMYVQGAFTTSNIN